jgi:N-acetylmuramoyl-L-alanine amidase
VKQAGFYVLVGASMPNVLVELGYLSNRKEEQLLRSQDGQRKIAEALFKGIKDYKMKYEQALQEGGDIESP